MREGLTDGDLVQLHDGVTAGFLIAGVDERVERQRVVLGGGDFLFDEGSEDPRLNCSQQKLHLILARPRYAGFEPAPFNRSKSPMSSGAGILYPNGRQISSLHF